MSERYEKMMTKKEIIKWIKSLEDEKKDFRRDEIDRENIQDEINTLNWVLEN